MRTATSHICMIVPNEAVTGGIASVVNGYRGSKLEKQYRITYIESYRDGSKWQKFVKAVQGYAAFRRLLREDRPDLVHIHSSFGPSFYRKLPFILWSSSRGIPVVNHIHGSALDVFYEKASRRKQRLVRRIYGKCARLVVLAPEWKQRLSGIVPEDRIDILENYCPIPDEPYDRGRKKRQILYLGKLWKEKGCFDVPPILERVRKSCPDCRLVMAGDGERERVERALIERGIEGAVSFPGWVRGEEKETLLRESSIFLFPSYHEGMPMAVLEAMAYGMGIVATGVGGIPRLIRDGQDGCLAAPGDVEAMAAAVERLLTEEAYCQKLGRSARERAAADYSLERHLTKLTEIYERCLAGEKGKKVRG